MPRPRKGGCRKQRWREANAEYIAAYKQLWDLRRREKQGKRKCKPRPGYNRQLRAKMLAQGRCYACGEPASPTSHCYCEFHRVRYNQLKARRKFEAKQALGLHPIIRGPIRPVWLRLSQFKDNPQAIDFIKKHHKLFLDPKDQVLDAALRGPSLKKARLIDREKF